mmetsp:Transcript_3043/g.4695  ORF Transcript_3043/g.4695 Transcript_3043/m.4695 type:complete len:341 (+) Transcript_3043:245-1267(+)|eukprot:CAMPEP_0201718664 /NCGR_PEP_ID=MMETSP0593-20130828/4123_1 /ASSEMBLY_ACC=CAM_ASM_000672 /TAXON_ID=267983 /ORGANISM="Skeletonema japonicum, Strain CCMP2506" /LENGTH=340 /DNA_ID=CAMNT_0048209019 /DNA_START=210 /DNA_END=1232 /DNA_ORIENTATION=+
MSNSTSSGMTGLKDFSVDAQRRMFMEQQEKERAAAEARKQSRKIKAATAAGGASGIMMSGMMSNLENSKSPRLVGDDDDDSIGDDYSIGSEESFYVGIERADYAQPDNFEIYGEEKADLDEKEDRLGISRVSVKVINLEGGDGNTSSINWDTDIPIHSEKSSSLYEFMNGSTSTKTASGMSKKDVVVAKPLNVSSLDWKEENKLQVDHDDVEQVYEQEAAEGKFFINKLVGTAQEPRGQGLTVDVSYPMSPGAATIATSGNPPILSPLSLFSSVATGSVANQEDNAIRQMRERELKKDVLDDANKEVLAKVKELIAAHKDESGKVHGVELTQELEKLLVE